MSTRALSKHLTRHESALAFLRKIASKERTEALSSAIRLIEVQQLHLAHRTISANNQCRFLRIEGVQGPLPSSVSLSETKKILEDAAKRVGSGNNQQGIQGCKIHTNSISDSSQSSTAFRETWDFEDSAAPQGIQGCIDGHSDCAHFSTWLANCRHYGLANCDQQLQGIQSGRLTLAQVLAEQQAMIAEIAANYRKRAQELPNFTSENIQGAQGSLDLPDVAAPCPQGVQGDDCVRFKLWLENCHRFGLQDCGQQLQGLQDGRMTLAQLFTQQEEVIRKVVQQYQKPGSMQQTRSYSTVPEERTPASGKAPSFGAQVGGKTSGLTSAEGLSQRERLKRAVKEYGATVIVFHITISLASLGGFYLAVSSGIDMVGLLTTLGVGEAILQSKLATGTGTFVVAYAVHKVFAPVRIGITLTATPFIVRYLRSKGILKPPKTKK